MNLIIMLIVGGVIGWLASIIMRTDGQQGIFLNIVVGIVGAALAGYVITPFLGGAPITSGALDLKSLVVSLLGAVVLLGIV
ncbi:MAG: GlsB/YeaQ/YmgE family stress response membrane protein, partial [Sphingorhabdus sp.]